MKMKNSKLIQLMTALTQNEVADLADYLHSPIHNTKKVLIKLFEILRENYNACTLNDLDKKALWQKLFPNKEQKDNYLRRLVSELSTLIEAYIVFSGMKQDKEWRQLMLLKELNKRQLAKQFQRQLTKYRKEDTEEKSYHINHYCYDYLIESTIYDFERTQNNRATSLPTTSITKISQKIDVFYFVNKMQLYCEQLNSNKIVVSNNTDILFLDQILTIVQQDHFQSIPIIRLYYVLIQLLLDGSIDSFFQLKKELNKQPTLFPNKHLEQAYIYATNYCSQSYRDGKTAFSQEYFLLLQQALEQHHIFQDPYLSPHHFNNMIAAAARLKKYAWAKEFIVQYKVKLQPKYQENLSAYGLAVIAFHQQDYQQVLTHLRAVDFLDFFHKLNTDMLYLRTYYALKEYNALGSTISKIHMAILRDTDLPSNAKVPYRNFINIVKRLFKMIQEEGTARAFKNKRLKRNKAILKLRQDITETTPLVDREWLLQQANGLPLLES